MSKNKSFSNPRQAAIGAIWATDGGQQAQAALAATGLSGSAYQFCADLVYGVLRCRIRLRMLLANVLAKPRKLPPLMLIALEAAAYSLFFQDKAAGYAVVNETVKFVKKSFGQNLAQVANGALRRLIRLGEGEPPLRDLASQADFYAMPYAIAQIWQQAYGEGNAGLLLRRSFQRPHAALRVNLRRPCGAELLAALLAEPWAIAVGPGGVAFPPGKLPPDILGRDLAYWHGLGAFSWQQAGSQLILEKLKLGSAWQGAPIWDACAGRGGKTTALLEQGLEIKLATDTSLRRLRGLEEECARLNLAAPHVALASASFPPAQSWQGHILADVPCSGLGVLARRPDIKARFSPAAMAKLQEIQAGILKTLARVLAPGFELAYLTCTLNPAENEDQIANLLTAMPGLTVARSWQTPHDHPWLEGMFGTCLRKTLPA